MRKLHLPIVALFLLVSVGEAADAPQGTEPYSKVPLADPTADMTPQEAADAQTAINTIKAKHDLLFGTGNVNADLYKQVEAKRIAENESFMQQYKTFSGIDSNAQASTVDIGGGFTLNGRMVQSPRHFRDTRYFATNPSFAIIDANKNILDDENRRLNKIANKIQKSKFACGQFDWIVQLRGMFNKAALVKYVDKLAESALAAAPMAFLANLSPTLYEIVKFLRMTASMELDADKIQCHQMEEAFTDIGARAMRGDGYADCIKANQNLGVTEAHRICNQDSSPFDGIENMAGKIVGLNANNPNMNLTTMLADRLTQDPTPQSIKQQKNIQTTSADKQAADAEVAANPDPGAKPSFPDGSPEMTAWQEASDKHENALEHQATATGDLNNAVNIGNGASQDTGVWGSLANSFASNLPNILGPIDLSTKSDIQFGRQRQYQLILQYQHQAFKLATDFCSQLELHYPLVIANDRDPTSLGESYSRLQAFMYATMKAPWTSVQVQYQIGDSKTGVNVRCGYETIDKLSVLWTEYQIGDANSVARTTWADAYRTVEAINTISRFELYDYLWNRAQMDKDTVLTELASMGIAKGADTIYQKVEANLDEYIALISRKRSDLIPDLVQCIDSVNAFPLHRGRFPKEIPTRSTPAADNSQIGR